MESEKIKTSIYVMMFVSLLLGVFISYASSPAPVKLLFSMGAWYCFFRFPYAIVKQNDFSRISNLLLRLIVILTIVAVIRSSLDDSAVEHGSKWITMFCNPDCTLMLLAPCFAFLGYHEDSLCHLKKALQTFLILGTMLIVLKRFVTPGVLWFSVAFFPYLEKKYKILMIISLFAAVFRAFFDEETSRTSLVIIGFAIASWFLAYVVKSKLLVTIFCILSIILPLIFAVLTLMNPGFSVFSIILEFVFDQTGSASYATDTRTFLYMEMAKDLSLHDAWLWGKGAYSHYFSWYFSVAKDGDVADRLASEVTLLQLLLRSGIVYAVLYYLFVIVAVFSAIRKSQNNFLLSVSILASGWVFVSCMSYLNGCEFRHLGFFILLGCCLSPYWLEKSDDEINEILES